MCKLFSIDIAIGVNIHLAKQPVHLHLGWRMIGLEVAAAGMARGEEVGHIVLEVVRVGWGLTVEQMGCMREVGQPQWELQEALIL